MFRQSVSEILGGAESAPPPGCEMGPKSPALLGLRSLAKSLRLWLRPSFWAWLSSPIWVRTCRLTAWLVRAVAICTCSTVWKGLDFQKKTLSLCLFHMFAQWLNMPSQFGLVVLLKINLRNRRASRNVHVVLSWVPSTTPTQRLLISLDYRHFPTGEFSSVPDLTDTVNGSPLTTKLMVWPETV